MPRAGGRRAMKRVLWLAPVLLLVAVVALAWQGRDRLGFGMSSSGASLLVSLEAPASTAVAASPTATASLVPTFCLARAILATATPEPQRAAGEQPGAALRLPAPTKTPASVAPSPPPPTPTSPPPSPTAEPSPQPQVILNAQEQQLLDAINALRVASGLAPVVPDDRLVGIARTRSREMAEGGYFSHVSPEGDLRYATLLQQAGVPCVFHAEILAKNSSAPAESPSVAMSSFAGSPPHRSIITDQRFRHAGVGFVRDQWGNSIFTIVFID